MSMKKQPEGIKRVARGERKTGEDGRKLPPEQYDILQHGAHLGWTARMSQGKWNAYALNGEHALLLANHTEAVQYLVDTHAGTERISEASSADEAAQVAPQGPSEEHQAHEETIAGWSLEDPPVDHTLDPVFQEPPDDDWPEEFG